MQLLGNSNFMSAALSILTLEILKVKIVFLLCYVQNVAKFWFVEYRTAYKIRARPRDFTKLTGIACYVIFEVFLSRPYQALYKGQTSRKILQKCGLH